MLIIVLLNGGAYIYFFAGSKVELPHSEQGINKLERKLQTITQETGSREFAKKAIPKHLQTKPTYRPKIVHSSNSSANKISPSTEDERTLDSYEGELIEPKSSSTHYSSKLAMPVVEHKKNDFETEINESSSTLDQTYNLEPSSESDALIGYPHLSELTIHFQKSIPTLIFNSHIYSDIPDSRRVMINNLYLREGQGFSEMVLIEIGEFYIAIEKDGTSFKIPVLRDWLGG